mgnify:CR=1 FL=1
MRTKEKFYDNLSKFQVSHDKKVERFEFRDVKTLNALVAESKKIKKAGEKAGENYSDATMERGDWQKKQQSLLKTKKMLEQKLESTKKQALKMVDVAESKVTKIATENNNAIDKYNKAYDLEEKFSKEYKSAHSAAESHISNMKSAISAFESSAKSLGVYDKVASKIAEYKKAAEQTDSF